MIIVYYKCPLEKRVCAPQGAFHFLRGIFPIKNQRMRIIATLFLTLFVPASAPGETNEAAVQSYTGTDYSPMTQGEKINFHLRSSADPASVFASAFSAGISHARNSVPEWGQGMEGYGRRFASSLGRKTVERTTRHGLKILLREDPRYFYSDRHGIKPRTLHAIGEIFVAHKDSGDTRPNYSYFAGIASGIYISRLWRPENSRNSKDFIQDAAVSIGIQSVKNVFTEFWPDIKKKFLDR